MLISSIYSEIIGEIEENSTNKTALLVKSAMQLVELIIGIMKALPVNSKLHTKQKHTCMHVSNRSKYLQSTEYKTKTVANRQTKC